MATTATRAKIPQVQGRMDSRRRSTTIRRRVRASATQENGGMKEGNGLQVGDAVRVVESVMVYHVPKKNQGIDLKGMNGQVVGDARVYKGKEISANLPWKVQFEIQPEEEGKKNTKFFAHLEEHELERT